jgi:hypothetical protein
MQEALERLAFLIRVRFRVPVGVDQKWPPGLEQFDVFQHEDARFALHRPPQRYPRRRLHALHDAHAAFALLKCLPYHAHGLAVRDLDWIRVPHALGRVYRVRMVSGLHGQRLRIVIEGAIDWVTEPPLQFGGSSAAVRKFADHQLFAEMKLHSKLVALHDTIPF